MSLFPIYNYEYEVPVAGLNPLVDNDLWNMCMLYPLMQQELGATKPWSAVVDVRGFREHEVKIETKPETRRVTVSARHEGPEGDFQELRRAVVIPEDVELDKVKHQFRQGQLQLHGPRKKRSELKQQQLAAPQWKMSDNGQHMSSEVSLEGFKPEEIRLRQQGRWITMEASHQTSTEDGVSSNRRVVLRNLLPEGVKPSTLRADRSVSGALKLTVQTDADSSIMSRDIPIEPMVVN